MSRPRRIVLTGGPGAGKTAVLETVKRTYGPHIVVAPEAASILFGGGFPRDVNDEARCATQRAIFHVQLEVETILDARPGVEVVLCDRGTVDGLAYWPRADEDLFAEVHTSLAEQLARYDVVIHLEPPPGGRGYHRNGTRIESAIEAAAIDARIAAAWQGHPRCYTVPSEAHFIDKARRVIAILDAEIPGGAGGPRP